ncbi:site-specific DNA-methyltransferase [Segatella copri]|uniref:site-specific DNA-methyltransferase n=1 Tax=Segatella copri TaxID=165179 RepID=UPI001C4971FC|nr:site-specific DNA-methyltransferase [Segatella copri]MBW0024388.1 site-specific DNA-methyltransferase [Segatella copri]
MNKYELAKKINELDGLTNEEKSELLKLLRSQKKYGLVWEDKPEDAELRMVDEMPVLEEVPERAIVCDAPDAPNHILIEGDNLEALTALTYTHTGKIDVIYIDPPYNTGNKDFVYNDSFVDRENGYRHSMWLSFMNKRLKIAKNLLSEKGVIFISIDDNEQAQLKILCDEIFGLENFIGDVSWQRTYSIRNDSKGIPAEVEHLLVFSKSDSWQPNKLPRTEDMNSSYANPDGDRCDWMSGSPVAPGAATHQGMVYAIQHPITGEFLYPSSRACWRYAQNQMLEYMNGWCEYMLEDLHDEEQRAKVCGIDVSKLKKDVKAIVLVNDLDVSKKKAMAVYKNGPWPRFFFTNKGKGGIRRKVYLDSVGGRIATNYWPYEETGHTDEAKKELIKIFGQAPFDTPKPTRLIRRVFDLSTDKNSLILDFFAGSGTTLHATMQLNSEDGGHRQCILATNNENGICENVTYERNRRVIQGYTTPKGEEIPGLTHNNLRYYKTKLLPRQQTVKNKRALVEASTELLCIKNNVYTEQTCFAGRKLKPSCARYFDNGETKMLVIYNELTVDAFAETIYHMDVEGKILIYVFSNTRYAYDDNFEDVLDKVELCALPAAIYDAYRNILPEENQMFEEPLEAEESADGADLAENADEAQSTNTTNEGLLSFDFQNE